MANVKLNRKLNLVLSAGSKNDTSERPFSIHQADAVV